MKLQKEIDKSDDKITDLEEQCRLTKETIEFLKIQIMQEREAFEKNKLDVENMNIIKTSQPTQNNLSEVSKAPNLNEAFEIQKISNQTTSFFSTIDPENTMSNLIYRRIQNLDSKIDDAEKVFEEITADKILLQETAARVLEDQESLQLELDSLFSNTQLNGVR